VTEGVVPVGGEIITRVLEPEVSTGGLGDELELTTGGLGVTEGVVVVGAEITIRVLEPELVRTGGGELEVTGGALEDDTGGGLEVEPEVVTGGSDVIEVELAAENVEVEVETMGGGLEAVDGAEVLLLELGEVELPEEVLVVTGGGLEVTDNELVVLVVGVVLEVLFVVGTDEVVELVLVL